AGGGRPGAYPLVVYPHPGGGNRRTATFVTTHLASHGYLVAAVDHSEQIAPELAPRDGETAAERAARREATVASRVPDVHLLLDHLLGGGWEPAAIPAPHRIGLVGHTFGPSTPRPPPH